MHLDVVPGTEVEVRVLAERPVTLRYRRGAGFKYSPRGYLVPMSREGEAGRI